MTFWRILIYDIRDVCLLKKEPLHQLLQRKRVFTYLFTPSPLMESSSSGKVTSFAEKERFFDSVIRALQNNDNPSFNFSISLAQALVLRAQLYSNDHAQEDHRSNPDYLRKEQEFMEQAYQDVSRAAALDPHHPTVWRLLATLEERRNDLVAAVHAYSQWAQFQPQFSTKIQMEIGRLEALAKGTIES